MIGQEKLLKEINSYTLDNFPHTVLITGERGSGKHTLTEEIVAKFKLPVIHVFDSCKKLPEIREYIQENIYNETTPKFYIFDLVKLIDARTRSDIYDSIQYNLLKLAEEPLQNIFIIILSETKNTVLNTIINRCRVFEMGSYTPDELLTFAKCENEADKKLLANVLRTPGQVTSANPTAVKKCIDTVHTIIDKIETINLPNLLKVVNMINYKDEFDKIDFNLFLDVMPNMLFESYFYDNKPNYYNYYMFTMNEFKKPRQFAMMDRERFIEHFLVSFWEVAHGL